MATSGGGAKTLEELRLLAELAGLGMSQQEVEELKPLYDLYAQYIRQLHSIDLKAEEIGVAFHPDWTAGLD